MNVSLSNETNATLLEAITDAQESVRAHDVKAEILTAIVAVLVGGLHTVIDPSYKIAGILGTGAIALGSVGALLLGLVLLPRAAPRVNCGTYQPTNAFFPGARNSRLPSVQVLASAAAATDWTHELAFELLKVIAIRNRKSFWFKGAVILTGASVFVGATALLTQRLTQ